MVRRARLDHRLEDAAQEIDVRAPRVLGGELDVVGVLARELHRLHRRLEHLVGLHAQLLLHVDRAGGDEGVDAPASCARLDAPRRRAGCRSRWRAPARTRCCP